MAEQNILLPSISWKTIPVLFSTLPPSPEECCNNLTPNYAPQVQEYHFLITLCLTKKNFSPVSPHVLFQVSLISKNPVS